MQPDGSRKLGCELLMGVFGLLVGIVGVASALYANFQSERAINVANEANKLVSTQNALIQQGGSPELTVQRLYEFGGYDGSLYSDERLREGLCLRSDGVGYWNDDMGVVFDVSNLGGRAASLVRVEGLDGGAIRTESPRTEVTARYNLFETRDDFLAWVSAKVTPSTIDMTTQNFVFSALPMVIDPGETKRLILKVIVEATMSRDPVTPSPYLLSAGWLSEVSFFFAGDIVRNSDVFFFRPYELEFSDILVDSFRPCELGF